MPKPKIYIAAPFFNPRQVEIVVDIETTLEALHYEYYSPRLHSGSDKLTPEQRNDPKSWEPVFASNASAIDDCDVMIAVIEYALPETYGTWLIQDLRVANPNAGLGEVRRGVIGMSATRIELPDAGVVWEMGNFYAIAKLVIAYHPTATPDKLNLMLSHGTDGFVTGVVNLATFLTIPDEDTILTLPPGRILKGYDKESRAAREKDAMEFNWSVAKGYGNEVE